MVELRCGICGLDMEPNERLHNHIPDFYLHVWNCRAQLMRHREFEGGSRDEVVDLELPESWVDFILWTCGGSISMSGLYRLPGCIWEWVVLKLSGDDAGAEFVARRVDSIVRAGGHW